MKRRASRSRDSSTVPRRTTGVGAPEPELRDRADAPRWRERIDDLERSLSRVTECMAARESDPLCALEAMCAEHVAVLTRHSWAPVLLLEIVAGENSLLKRRVVRMIAGQRSGIVLLLVQARQRGLIAPDGGVRVAADTLLTLLQGLALRMRLGEPAERVRAAGSVLVKTYLTALRTHGSWEVRK